MKELQTVLNKVVVQEFYRRNAGFFLVVFFLMFGVQQPATFFISPYFLTAVTASSFFTALVLAVLLLYYLKCLHFFYQSLDAPENEFLTVSSLLPRSTINKGLGQTFLLLFLPAVIYAVWLAAVGVWKGNVLAAPLVLLYLVLLLMASVAVLGRRLEGHRPGFSRSGFWQFPAFPWPVALWPLRFLAGQEGVSLLLTKLFSVALLLLFINLYPYPQYDVRPTQIGFLTGVVVHLMLLLRIQEFQEVHLGVHRQLPFTMPQRLGALALLYLVLLLPEAFLAFRALAPYTWYSLGTWAELWLFGAALLLLLFALLYKPRLNQEKFIKQVFFLYMGLLLLLLFSPPLWVLALGLTAAAGWGYRRWYYRYEVQS